MGFEGVNHVQPLQAQNLTSTDNERTMIEKLAKTMRSLSKNKLKKEKLEASLTTEQKELLLIAAEIEGTTLTDFVIRSAQKQARQVIEEHSKIQLCLEDSQVFVESLLNPPEPNSRMLAKAREYIKNISESK